MPKVKTVSKSTHQNTGSSQTERGSSFFFFFNWPTRQQNLILQKDPCNGEFARQILLRPVSLSDKHHDLPIIHNSCGCTFCAQPVNPEVTL